MLLKTKSRLILLAILGLCIAPIVLAQWLWSNGQVQGGQSYGQLLAQPALSRDAQWRLVAHDPAGCTASLHSLAQSAQQLQIAQGKERERIRSVAACDSTLPQQFSVGLYLIDPHGNAVIFYPPEQLAQVLGRQKVIREIGKILKNNRGLG
ncbi:hypothetical protein [Deefgea rivuli]|uniref:hypothetical protein n=1 Tax=Deefgea rivuli TaxID=400948 RepID=UPI0012EB5EFB|nr:hypothetical protein [Deefgea rivuli]